jgi:predicted CopG family antitoxin
MPTKTIELEMDAIAKLEAAKWSTDESLSAVVRRAQFPGKPHVARELLEDFKERAGRSPLNEEAFERLDEAQKKPIRSPSHWD